MYTEDYEQEIDLKDLLFVLLYRWRILLLAAVIGAALLGGYKGVKGNPVETDLPQTESYQEEVENYKKEKLALETSIENLQNSMEEQSNYLAMAPLMQINPYKEAFSSADVLVEISDIRDRGLGSLLNAFENGLRNGDYIQKTAQTMETEERYVRETIRVNNNLGMDETNAPGLVLETQNEAASRGILHISVVGPDKDYTEAVMKSALNQVEELHNRFETELKAHQIRVLNQSSGEQVDRDLLNQQQTVRNNVAALQQTEKDLNTSLDGLEEPADHTSVTGSSKDVTKYVIIGFLAGGFVSVCAVAGLYIMGDKVTSDKEIMNRFHIKSLGAFSVVPKKRMFGFIDSWLRRLAGDDKIWPDDVIYEMIEANAANYAEGKKALFVTGLASQEQMAQVCEHLKAALPQTQIVSERNLVESASARRKLAEAQGVILVEERGNSKYSVIAQELELAKNVNTDVIGVIVA